MIISVSEALEAVMADIFGDWQDDPDRVVVWHADLVPASIECETHDGEHDTLVVLVRLVFDHLESDLPTREVTIAIPYEDFVTGSLDQWLRWARSRVEFGDAVSDLSDLNERMKAIVEGHG